MSDSRYHCSCGGSNGLSGTMLGDGSVHQIWCNRILGPTATVGSPPPALSVFRLQPDAALPRRAMEGSIGYDVEAYLRTGSGRESTRVLGPQQTDSFATGIVAIAPHDHALLVCSRSGMATSGIVVTNAPGVIDPDYTGELKILLTNIGWEPFHVKHGHRIAQLLVIPKPATPPVVTIDALPTSQRGQRGFGSTGD